MQRYVSHHWTASNGPNRDHENDPVFSKEQQRAMCKLLNYWKTERIWHPWGFKFHVILSGSVKYDFIWYEAKACPKEIEIREYVCKILRQRPDKRERGTD